VPKKLKPEVVNADFDDSVSPHVESCILEFPNGELILSEFKCLIGTYRFQSKNIRSRPTKLDTIDHLGKVNRQITKLRQSIDLIPQSALAIMESEYNLKSREGYIGYDRTFYQLKQRLDSDLLMIQEMANHAAHEAQAWDGKEIKSATLERSLLAQVSTLLRTHTSMKKIKAASIAAELLRNSGIHNMPSPPSDARRRIRETK